MHTKVVRSSMRPGWACNNHIMIVAYPSPAITCSSSFTYTRITAFVCIFLFLWLLTHTCTSEIAFTLVSLLFHWQIRAVVLLAPFVPRSDVKPHVHNNEEMVFIYTLVQERSYKGFVGQKLHNWIRCFMQQFIREVGLWNWRIRGGGRGSDYM